MKIFFLNLVLPPLTALLGHPVQNIFFALIKKSSGNPYLKICDHTQHFFSDAPLKKKNFTSFHSTFGTPGTKYFLVLIEKFFLQTLVEIIFKCIFSLPRTDQLTANKKSCQTVRLQFLGNYPPPPPSNPGRRSCPYPRCIYDNGRLLIYGPKKLWGFQYPVAPFSKSKNLFLVISST